MKQTRTVEISTGLFIFLGLAALFFLVTQTTNIRAYGTGDTYQVTARFTNVGSLKVRAPVRMAGVTIGRVTAVKFDAQRLDAEVTMAIDSKYDKIPADTSASILTEGLLGGQYVGLEPGGAEESLKDGDRIEFTQSAIVLEQLIGRYLFNQASQGGK
ncbi:MAG: outer membrane lipid asymmetry maintenance protein MlaD [Gammaproteobacteria bacterium]|jgi:phospholipid/cholesterol/gamma-HCH transport system substrate-binding protein